MSGWRVMHSETLIDEWPWVRVIRQAVELEDGKTVIDDFYRVDVAPFAVIFAVTVDGRVPLVTQYRQAVGKRVCELPAGYIPEGEDPLETARRELREEAGLTARRWEPLGVWTVDPNRGCGTCYGYLALEAERVGEPMAVDLQMQSVDFVTVEEARAFWLSDECVMLASTAVMGRALAKLDTSRGERG